MENRMGHAQNHRIGKLRRKGSATVEALIVLPVFMVVMLTLAYIIRVFFVYSTMQSALQTVARNISSASYYYYVSGLKDYSERLGEAAQEAEDTLNSQKDTILGAVDTFSDALSAIRNNETFSGGNLNDLINQYSQLGKDLSSQAGNAITLVKDVLDDPKGEVKLLLTVFAQKLTYEGRKQIICLIAREMLNAELLNRQGSDRMSDPYLTLGLDKSALNFQHTEVFGDKESLEFVVIYKVKTPAPFNLIPEITLSNRVKVIAWTGGRGQSVKVSADKPGNGQGDEDSSIWTEMDNDQRYWDRGLEIEKKAVSKIGEEAKSRSMNFIATDTKFPMVDALIYDANTVEIYDVFTLNPFMKTYQTTPSRIKSEIKKHGKNLMGFDFSRYPNLPTAKNVRRIVVVIVPKNATADMEAIVAKAAEELKEIGIYQVRLVRDDEEYHELNDSG
jgi:hypothetical protein